MARWVVLLALVVAVAGFSRLDGRGARRDAQVPAPSFPASYGVTRGMTVAQVRHRLAGQRAYPTRVHGSRCVMYATGEPRALLTFVCFDKANRVARVRTGQAPQTAGPARAF